MGNFNGFTGPGSVVKEQIIRIVLLLPMLLIITLIGCSTGSPDLSQTISAPPLQTSPAAISPTTSPPLQTSTAMVSPKTSLPTVTTSDPTPTFPLPTNKFGTVDASTLSGKVIFGYQGWFGCPSDGSELNKLFHWFDGSQLVVDFWPDTSNLTSGELCPTSLFDTEGNRLNAFSSYNPLTVMRHFLWMAEYGLDGVELQRFASELTFPEGKDFRDRVLSNVRLGAETYGRVFYIQYDAVEREYIQTIKDDWEYLVDMHKITESPQYLHHQSLPIVGLFGIGLTDRNINAQEAMDLILFFQEHPEPRYRARVLGGVPFFWRTLDRDSRSDSAWADVYRALDIISPWSVGRVIDKSNADLLLNQVIIPDLAETRALNIGYFPVIYPGFSWSNLYPGDPYNQTPRNGGDFYWKQAYNLVTSGVDMIYVAMFDEVDEGTAMFKLVSTAEELPDGQVLIPLNVDGYSLPSDWYLLLGGRTGAMLRGEIPPSPIVEGLEVLASKQFRILHLEFASTSDWNSLEILNPDLVQSIEIVSTEGELTFFGASRTIIDLNQSLENANASVKVTAWVDILIDPSSDAATIDFKLTKGHLGSTNLRFFTLEGDEERSIWEGSLSLLLDDETGENLMMFSVLLEDIESK